MCDYSLHAIDNRLAVQGERLIVHRFRTGSIGLAPAPDGSEQAQVTAKKGFWRNFFRWAVQSDRPVCAVCVPPGARLLLHSIPPRLQRKAHVEETEGVTFTQLSASEYRYRDAVRFSNGHAVLLQQLEPGQTAEVLTLTPEDQVRPAREEVTV